MRTISSIAAFVLSLAACVPVQVLAQEAQVPAEAFFQQAAIRNAELSPSGKLLAFITGLGQKRFSLVVLDLTTGQPLTRAGFDDADVINFSWVDDERLVFSAKDLQHAGSDEQRRNPGLFMVKTDGSRIKRLVRTGGHDFFTNGVDQRILDSNHILLAVPSSQPGVQPDEIILGRYDFSGADLDAVTPIWFDIHNLDWHYLEVGKNLPDHAMGWWFDSAGHPRALYTKHDGEIAYYWQGPGETGWRLLVKAPILKVPFAIQAVDDAGNLYVTVDRGPGETTVLTRFDFEKMAPSEKTLIEIPGFDFQGLFSRDGASGQMMGVRVYADAEATVWYDAAMRKFQEQVNAKLPGRVNHITCTHCGTPEMTALILSYSDQDPGFYYVYQGETKKWQRIMPVQKDIPAKRMATVEFRRIKARDRSDLPLWITRPADLKPGSSAPVVLMVHGGPIVRGAYWQWSPMNQFLASRGYLVIEPEFRGSAGYGYVHARAGFKQWGQTMEDDLTDALHWAQAQGLASPGHACIMGGSYGGYAALMGPVRSPRDYRCVIASSAVTDLELLLKGSWLVDDDDSRFGGRKYALPSLVGDIDKDAAMIKANSPVLLASQMKVPVMLAWGSADLRVPIDYGKRMREALIAAGNPPEWVVYEDEGHGWANTANQIDYAKRVEAFLAKNMK